MSFPHECNGCGSQFDVPEELAGQQATCAACGRLMDLPLPPSEMGAPAGPGSGSESFLDVRAKPHLPIGERSEGAAWRTPSAVRLAIGVSVASVLIGVIVVSYLMQQRGRSSWRDRVRADRSSRRPFDPEASYIYVDNNSEQLIVAQLDGGAAKEIAPWDILRMDVRAGAHRVSVEGKGRKRWEKRLDVRPGRTYIADPAGIGHYGVWELSYTPVGQQPHAVLSRRTQLDHRWGGRTLHTVTLPVHYQIREPPAQIIRTRVSTVRRMLRKLPPAPVPEALIKRMLDMKLQGVFREVYHETSRMKALEEGAKLGLDEVRIYLFAQLEGKNLIGPPLISSAATPRWSGCRS